MSEKESYLAFLKDSFLSWGGHESQFDFSAESLVPIWQLSQLYIKRSSPLPRYKKNLNQLPIWILLGEQLGFYSVYEDEGYSEEAIRLLNGLGYYFGDVLVKNNSATWEPAVELNASIVGAFIPVIRLRDRSIWKHAVVTPFNIVKSVSVNTWFYKDDLNDLNLLDKYHKIINYFIKSTPPPQPKSQFKGTYPNLHKKLQDIGIYELEELVSIEILSKEERVTIDSIECNKQFYTTPALEHILGENKFQGLESSLMSIDGIKFAAQEDRELFYLKSAVAKKKLQIAILNKLEEMLA